MPNREKLQKAGKLGPKRKQIKKSCIPNCGKVTWMGSRLPPRPHVFPPVHRAGPSSKPEGSLIGDTVIQRGAPSKR